MFHGHDDDPGELAATLLAGDVVDPDRMALLAPVGPTITAQGGHAWFPSAADDHGPALADALDGLDALVTATRRTEALDQLPTVYLGYSQGGAAALGAAFRSGSGLRPRMVVGLASWLPSEPDIEWAFDQGGDVEAVLVHGTDDEVVPPQLGRSAARVLERHGVRARFRSLESAHLLAPLLSDGVGATLLDLLDP